MLIDWFTLVAQLVNFIILIWLLKRFLYKPVLRALDAREELIAKQINDAAKQISEANIELESYQEKNRRFEKERNTLLEGARKDAEAKRGELIGEARMEAEQLRQRLNNSLDAEQRRIRGAIMRRAAEEVFSVARRTLNDLASAELEERMIQAFTKKMAEMGNQETEEMGKAFSVSAQPVVVLSSFEMSDESREIIRRSINDFLAFEGELQFKVASDQISGIEISNGSYSVSWNISEYLSTLESGVIETIEQNMDVAKSKSG